MQIQKHQSQMAIWIGFSEQTVQLEIVTNYNYLSSLYVAQFVILPFIHIQMHSMTFGLQLLL